MGCQHKWERRDKQPWYLPFYVCTKCEMELSVCQYEAVHQAHREGWEQCRQQTLEIIEQNTYLSGHVQAHICETEDIRTDIAAMEYKEPTNG